MLVHQKVSIISSAVQIKFDAVNCKHQTFGLVWRRTTSDRSTSELFVTCLYNPLVKPHGNEHPQIVSKSSRQPEHGSNTPQFVSKGHTIDNILQIYRRTNSQLLCNTLHKHLSSRTLSLTPLVVKFVVQKHPHERTSGSGPGRGLGRSWRWNSCPHQGNHNLSRAWIQFPSSTMKSWLINVTNKG